MKAPATAGIVVSALMLVGARENAPREIVYGAAAIDDNGRGLHATGLGHGDAMHLSDLDPDRPGLEVFNAPRPRIVPVARKR